MTREELEEFLEMVRQEAFIDEYGFGPCATHEDISKWCRRFEELQNKLYAALNLEKEDLKDVCSI